MRSDSGGQSDTHTHPCETLGQTSTLDLRGYLSTYLRTARNTLASRFTWKSDVVRGSYFPRVTGQSPHR